MKIKTGETAGQQNYGPKIIANEGVDIAYNIMIVDLGTHEKEFKGNKKNQRLIQIGFEFPRQLHVFDEKKGKQPITWSNEFTLSLSDRANLRKLLENWRNVKFADGKEVNIKEWLGKPAIINIAHEHNPKTNKTYAKLASIKPVGQGQQIPKMYNKPMYFDMDEPVVSEFNGLHNWIKKKIMSSEEWSSIFVKLNKQGNVELPTGNETNSSNNIDETHDTNVEENPFGDVPTDSSETYF